MKKIYCLGDIHGRSLALKQVFERSEFDKENDTLIFIGDIVDRGWEPFECIEILLECKNLIAIEGNHDVNFHDWIITTHDSFGGRNGVQITKGLWLNEKNKDRKDILLSYFRKMVKYYIDDKNRLFIHGGYYEKELIKDQYNNFCWDRKMWERAVVHFNKKSMLKTADNFLEIYIGHTPTLNYGAKNEVVHNGIILDIGDPIDVPMYAGGVWNIDTGAGFSHGKLSMMNVDTKELFQSDTINDLYAKSIEY